MERLKGVDQKKETTARRGKSKNKPLKVVYISNPVKFKTSASEFRALVQELTGQDAEWPDPNKTSLIDDSRTAPKAKGHEDYHHHHHNHMVGVPLEVESSPEDHIKPMWSDLHFEPFDHDHDQILVGDHDHQMLEDFYKLDDGDINSVSQ
ncbi:hypothetical protein Ancab_031152 [Ancistrocladus abbreviatus]